MYFGNFSSLQLKTIVCLIVYDRLLPPGVKGLKYFSLRFKYCTDMKHLIVGKKFLLLENFNNQKLQ